jgi:hypothetical protein
MTKTYDIGIRVEVADAHSARSILAHLEELIKDGGELTLVVAQAKQVMPADDNKEKKE